MSCLNSLRFTFSWRTSAQFVLRIRMLETDAAGRKKTWQAAGVVVKGDHLSHPARGQASGNHEAHRLAHVSAYLHDFAARQRRRREGGARAAASRFGEAHPRRLRPSRDGGETQSAGQSGSDATGDEKRGEIGPKSSVSPAKIGISSKSFRLLASPTGFEPVLPP